MSIEATALAIVEHLVVTTRKADWTEKHLREKFGNAAYDLGRKLEWIIGTCSPYPSKNIVAPSLKGKAALDATR